MLKYLKGETCIERRNKLKPEKWSWINYTFIPYFYPEYGVFICYCLPNIFILGDGLTQYYIYECGRKLVTTSCSCDNIWCSISPSILMSFVYSRFIFNG